MGCRPEQSGIMPCRSTIDDILALRLLSDLHREFDHPLNVAYLDIKAAFDSIVSQALWKALRSQGTPDALLKLIMPLHENTGALSPSHPESFKPSSDDLRRKTRLCPCTSCVQHRHQLNSTPYDGEARDSSGA